MQVRVIASFFNVRGIDKEKTKWIPVVTVVKYRHCENGQFHSELTDAMRSIALVTKPASAPKRSRGIETICIQVALGRGRLAFVHI